MDGSQRKAQCGWNALTARKAVDGVPEAEVGVALAGGDEHEENDEEEAEV